MKLDVGCGAFPTGDVNIDLYVNDIGHRTGVKGINGGSVPPQTLNFKQWDLNKLPLPFADNSFNEVFCSHTIEHVNNPFALLSEMVRVSSDKVTVICPHRLGERATLPKNPFHKSYFGVKWFHDAARALHCNSRVRITNHAFLPRGFLPLVQLPLEITVEFRKC